MTTCFKALACKLSHRVAALTFTAIATCAAAQGTPAAAISATSPAAEYRVDGFRSARFGMRVAEVRATLARDFQPAPSSVKELENPAEKTTVLMVELPALDPGPGTAKVSYIFGASTQRLIHINVSWTSGDKPSEAERNLYTGTSLQLAKYFQSLPWKVNGTTLNQPQGINGLLLFAGVDAKNSAVELHLSGIAIVAATGPGPEPQGPVQVRIAYVANVQQPDVATVRVGAF